MLFLFKQARIQILFVSLALFLGFLFPVYSAEIPLTQGQSVVGKIKANGEKDTYILDLLANDKVTIRGVTTTGFLTTYLELYGPDGALVAEGKNKIDKALAVGGKYTLVVREKGERVERGQRPFLLTKGLFFGIVDVCQDIPG